MRDVQGEIKQRHQIQPDTFQNVCERYGIRADESKRVDMKRFYNEELLGNKIIALALVIVMNVALLSKEIIPAVWFFALPTAIGLLFSKRNYVGGSNE